MELACVVLDGGGAGVAEPLNGAPKAFGITILFVLRVRFVGLDSEPTGTLVLGGRGGASF